jgi:hypothetical protein
MKMQKQELRELINYFNQLNENNLHIPIEEFIQKINLLKNQDDQLYVEEDGKIINSSDQEVSLENEIQNLIRPFSNLLENDNEEEINEEIELDGQLLNKFNVFTEIQSDNRNLKLKLGLELDQNKKLKEIKNQFPQKNENEKARKEAISLSKSHKKSNKIKTWAASIGVGGSAFTVGGLFIALMAGAGAAMTGLVGPIVFGATIVGSLSLAYLGQRAIRGFFIEEVKIFQKG